MKLESKYKIVIWILMVLVVLNTTAIFTLIYKKSTAKPVPSDRFFKGRSLHHIIDEIGFSDEQKEIAFKMRDKHYKNNSEIFNKLHIQRQLLIKEFDREKIDTQKIDEIAKEIGNMHYHLKKETIRHFYDMRELCTPEQRKEFFSVMNNISEEFERPFHHRKQEYYKKIKKDSCNDDGFRRQPVHRRHH